MPRFCVFNKKTKKTSRCFGTRGKARAFCGRLNKLCRCRDFTIKVKRGSVGGPKSSR